MALPPLAYLWLLIWRDWRFGVVALFCFLPFAGIPSFVVNTKYAPVLKDALLVVPLYLSFFFAMRRAKQRIIPRRDPLVYLLAIFAATATVYVFRSSSLLVGLIGLKVWIAYFPMYLLGYWYVRRIEDFAGLVQLTALLAIVPSALALLELAVYILHGSFGFLGALQSLRATDGQQVVTFVYVIPRVPSTFTAASGYYNFALVALAAGVATWRVRKSHRWLLLSLLLASAAVGSGVRRSYITVPLVIVLATLLIRDRQGPRLRTVIGGLAGIAILLLLARVDLVGLATNTARYTWQALLFNLQVEFLPAAHHAFIGHGTGFDTNAAIRYGGASTTKWRENWYTKALLEFGWAGLVVVFATVAVMLVRTYSAAKSLGTRARRLTIPLWTVLFVTSLTMVKASEVDWDPMNIYFWFFAGALIGVCHVSTSLASGDLQRRPSSRGLAGTHGTDRESSVHAVHVEGRTSIPRLAWASPEREMMVRRRRRRQRRRRWSTALSIGVGICVVAAIATPVYFLSRANVSTPRAVTAPHAKVTPAHGPNKRGRPTSPLATAQALWRLERANALRAAFLLYSPGTRHRLGEAAILRGLKTYRPNVLAWRVAFSKPQPTPAGMVVVLTARNPPATTRYSYLLVRRQGRWTIAYDSMLKDALMQAAQERAARSSPPRPSAGARGAYAVRTRYLDTVVASLGLAR